MEVDGMLLKDYKFKLVFPECNPSATTVNALADLSDDISEVLPYLNAIIKGCFYNPDAGTLRFVKDGRVITLYPTLAAVSRLKDEIEAREVLDSLKELINNTYEKREQIKPSYKKGDELKVMDIYKLLPGTNCKECGEPTCFAFANKIVRQEANVSKCTPLHSQENSARREKLVAMLELAGYL
jgi:ArsR family metal-binding transcriptional regulator